MLRSPKIVDIFAFFSIGADCSEARALRGVSMVESTALARNKNTPVTSWINFFAQFVEWDGVVVCRRMLHFCPICFMNVGVRLVLWCDWGGVLEVL